MYVPIHSATPDGVSQSKPMLHCKCPGSASVVHANIRSRLYVRAIHRSALPLIAPRHPTGTFPPFPMLTCTCTATTAGDSNANTGPTPRCKYYPIPINECVSAERDVPCSDLPGKLCAPEGRCEWFPDDAGDGVCDDCPNGKTDCVEAPPAHSTDDDTSTNPDDGKPCNSFSGENVRKGDEPHPPTKKTHKNHARLSSSYADLR